MFWLSCCVSCVVKRRDGNIKRKDVLSFVFKTFEDTKHKSQNTKLESQKFETQNSKHPYTKHNVQMGTS